MSTCRDIGEQACGTSACRCNTGRMHYERRRAQAAAAQKAQRKDKHDFDWKKEERNQ